MPNASPPSRARTCALSQRVRRRDDRGVSVGAGPGQGHRGVLSRHAAHPATSSNARLAKPQWLGNAVRHTDEPYRTSGWPRQADAVFTVGGFDAAIMISLTTPWTLGVMVFGLELFVPAASVLVTWFVRNGS